jgi:endonuclease YncB( thermonuclease family)
VTSDAPGAAEGEAAAAPAPVVSPAPEAGARADPVSTPVGGDAQETDTAALAAPPAAPEEDPLAQLVEASGAEPAIATSEPTAGSLDQADAATPAPSSPAGAPPAPMPDPVEVEIATAPPADAPPSPAAGTAGPAAAPAAPTAEPAVVASIAPVSPSPDVDGSLQFPRVSVLDAGSLRGILGTRPVIVRIAGIQALPFGQRCGPTSWPCGGMARAELARHIGERTVVCTPESEHAPASRIREVMARCTVEGTDLAEWLAANGWGKPAGASGSRLAKVADEAEQWRRGQFADAAPRSN